MPREYPSIPQEQAAVGQLHTAIRLWFQEADVPSIHTLAAASQGMLQNIARERGVTLSSLAEKVLKTKSHWFRDFMRRPQNYFKHGNPKLEKGYHPRHPEVILMDSIMSCSELFGGKITPLMATFLAYIGVTEKRYLINDKTRAVLLKGGKIEELASLKRKDFLDRILPLFVQCGDAHIV